MRKKSVLLLLAFGFILAACAQEPTPTVTPVPPTSTATLDYAATESFEATEAQMVVDARQTEEMAFQYASETAVAAITETEIAYATATREMEKTNNAATSQFMRTEAAAVKQTETAVYQAVVDEYVAMVEGLAAEGYLTRTEGTYYELEDVTWEEAKINYYDAFPTGYSPTDFVLTTHIRVSADSDKTNWWNSGCGFLIRYDLDTGNHYRMFATMDGYGDFSRIVSGNPSPRQPGYFGKVNTPSDEFDLTLVVEGSVMRLFINGNYVVTYTDSAIPKGLLAYSLVSGTNAGYGTRCEFSDGVLYELDPQ